MNKINKDVSEISSQKQIKDIKKTLEINWGLSKNLLEKEYNFRSIMNLALECEGLIEENISLNEGILRVEGKTRELEEKKKEYEEKFNKDYSSEKSLYSKLQSLLSEEKSKLSELNLELEKSKLKSMYKGVKIDIFILSPTRKTVEMHQEILSIGESIESVRVEIEKNNERIKMLEEEYGAVFEANFKLKKEEGSGEGGEEKEGSGGV